LPSTALYQDGRGNDPMIEVGSTVLAEALYMGCLFCFRQGGTKIGSFTRAELPCGRRNRLCAVHWHDRTDGSVQIRAKGDEAQA